ncbi:MAG: murein biosynthesis integral membrane protein MurJ [Myxococcota bacterium]
MQDGAADRSPGSRFTAAALLLAASVLLSRLLGFVREMVLAYQLGTRPELGAYYAAFQIPDLLNYFLAGGALSIAFVPFYTRTRAEQGEAAAARLFATVFGTMATLSLLATALLWWRAEALVSLQFPRFDPAIRDLTVRLTRILLPAQVFFVAGGIVRAVLMARGSFATQALAPLLYNAGIIAGGAAFGASLGAEGFAWGALAGAVVGPFLVPLWDAARRDDLALGFRIAPTDRDFLRYLGVAAPLMLGISLLTVDEWYDKWFGGLISESTIAQLGLARRLMQLPVAVVGQAIATAALPILSQLWVDGRKGELDRVVGSTLRGGIALSVLAAGGFFVLADPVVALVYQRGAFTAADRVSVATLLQIFALAVPAWTAQQIAVRPFFARGDTWRPMLIGSVMALAAVPLYLALGARHGAAGIAAAGVVGMTANALVTLAFARWLHGAPALRPLAATTGRSLAVAALSGAAARAAVDLALEEAGPLAELVVGGAVFVAAVAAGVALAGDAPMRRAAARAVRRLRPGRPPE